MNLLSLEIENFGLFRRQQLEFGSGLQLVLGPNEAGKSTLLQLLRESLFGFAVQNRYVFEEHTGEMASVVRVQWRDGRFARFRRRKGRNETVKGEFETTGETFDEAGLTRLLGNASVELYRHVFAFSLAEVSSGEASLTDTNLRDSLYGASAGGLAAMQKLQRRLNEELAALFNPRARTKAKINAVLGQLRQGKQTLRDLLRRPAEYEAAVATHRQAREQKDEQGRELNACQRQDTKRSRLGSALPLWNQLQDARRILATIEVPENFPRDAEADLGRGKQLLEELRTELAAVDEEATEVAAKLQSLQLAPRIVGQAAALRRVQLEVEQIRGFRRDQPLRAQQAALIKDTVQAQLQALNPNWNHQQLEQFQTGLAQRDAIERMQRELIALEKALAELHTARQIHERDLANVQRRLDELPATTAVGAYEDLLAEEAQWRADRARLGELAQSRASLEPFIDQLTGQVAATVPNTLRGASADATMDATWLQRLPVPLSTSVAEYSARFESQAQMVAKLRELHAADGREIDEYRRELTQIGAREAIPDRQQLLAARARREQGWRLIRETFVEGHGDVQATTAWLEGGTGDLPQAYEQAVVHADTLADERQAKAERVAHCEQLAAKIERLEMRRQAIEAELNAALADQAKLEAEWQQIWRASGVVPQTPAAMLEWLGRHADLCHKLAEREALAAAAASGRAATEAFESRLRVALGATPDVAVEELLRDCRQRTDQARALASTRQKLVADRDQKRSMLDAVSGDLVRIEGERQAWQSRWLPLLEEFGFPAEWDVHFAVKALQGLSDARRDYVQAEALDGRAMEMQKGLESFTEQVRGLVADLAPDLDRLPPEDAVVELNLRLDRGLEAARAHAELTLRQTSVTRRLASKREELKQAEKRRAELLGLAGTEQESVFIEVARRARQRATLSDACDTLEKQIASARGTEDPTEFAAELARCSADSLAADALAQKAHLEQAQQAYDEAVRHEKATSDAVRAFEDSSGVLAATAELESGRGQLLEQIENYAPRAIAAFLLQQAASRFERTQQPAVLAETRRLFERLTGGRYVDVRRQLDEQGTLLVAEASGKSKTPAELSTGTREQLYLAIRLAYVKHYCERNEPLPIVMDDVLVNFDDGRAKQTLEVLFELADQMQILLFTCHQETARLARAIRPAVCVLELGSESLSDSSEGNAPAAAASERKRKVKR